MKALTQEMRLPDTLKCACLAIHCPVFMGLVLCQLKLFGLLRWVNQRISIILYGSAGLRSGFFGGNAVPPYHTRKFQADSVLDAVA